MKFLFQQILLADITENLIHLSNLLIPSFLMQTYTSKNLLSKLFQDKKERILSVYYTAGFPRLEETLDIALYLQESGADIIEIGMPFSDPIADGETIQKSNQTALNNGMSLQLLFEQLKDLRKHIQIPVLLMGYLNPVLQFGMENFCKKAAEIGINGVILPDLPMLEYETEYRSLFEKYGLTNIFLITPQSNEPRIRKIDSLSNGFIYMVSSSGTTGKTELISEEQINYFEKIKAMNLDNPCLIGFGISDKKGFDTVCKYADGAIIGSAFIKAISESTDLKTSIRDFMSTII